MLGSTWSEAFQRGGQDGKEAIHSGADHHCTAGGRGRSGPRQIREANQSGARRPLPHAMTNDIATSALLTHNPSPPPGTNIMADNDTVTPILADDGDDIAPALYPNSTRQFGKGNLTSQRRVVGWKHIVGDRMVAASLPRSSSRSRSLGSYATGMAEAKDLFLATLPIGSGILAYWFAARGRSSSGDNDK